jgi:1-acyl-sn-glycerol-3-phosphate acyltransferase
MNFLKNILARVFAVWALLAFVGSMLLFFIPMWITQFFAEPKKTIYVFKVFEVWITTFFVLAGVKRIIKGKENFKKGVAYIVICNHNSFLDVPLASPAIPGPNKTIAKEEMAKIPIFATVYKSGSVLVNRKSEESRRTSYKKMKAVLEMGFHMCIYPEGTRNKTDQPMQRFHDGAFKLAHETGNAIIPAVILYTRKVLPADKTFYFWPHRVEMHFLEPIPVNGRSALELKAEAFTIMQDYYVQHQ